MTVKLLNKHHSEFLSLKGGCKGSSESTLVKVPHCWKSHVVAHLFVNLLQTRNPKIGTFAKSEDPDDNAAFHQKVHTGKFV